MGGGDANEGRGAHSYRVASGFCRGVAYMRRPMVLRRGATLVLLLRMKAGVHIPIGMPRVLVEVLPICVVQWCCGAAQHWWCY